MANVVAQRPTQDLRVIGVVGAAHFTSHFYQLVLSPLFPAMHATLGLSYGQLGLILTVFFSTSGVGQVAAGFLVDRLGPQVVLPFGVALLAGSVAGMAGASQYWLLLLLAASAGLGNSVYHPADFSVLTARVSPHRLARAYSVHTITGTLGWAAAPVVVLMLAEYFGNWRSALLIVGLAGVAAAAGLALNRADLRLPAHLHKAAAAPAGPTKQPFLSLPIVMAFCYFLLLAISLSGMQNFLPTMLPKVQDVSIAFATQALTAYLIANALGSLVGGYLADLTQNLDRIIGGGLAGAAALVLTMAFVPLPAAALFLVAALAGFLAGLTIPSRDMLVRQATPPGSTGKVFGFVYSGLDLGSLVAPVVIGTLLDRGLWHVPFVFIAAALGATIVAALGVKLSKSRSR
jgi:FSR family fosmidomycin resistance protein-like MFS transporter